VKKLVVSVLVLCSACDGSATDSPTSDASPDTSADAFDSGIDLGIDVPIEADTGCEGATSGLASLYSGPSCTTTIRILAKTNAIVAWNVQCGVAKSAVLSETEARAAFAPFATASDIPPYAPKAADYEMLRDGTPGDSFVFYVLAGDFGGLAAVSARRGEVAFYGNVVWGGTGKVRTPTSWRTGSETKIVCPTLGDLPKVVPLPTDELTLDDARVASVVDAIRRSPIVHAAGKSQVLRSTLLTVYPIDLGSGTTYPTLAEYVVLIESASIE